MPERVLNKDNYFDKLDELMNVLRKECPWDNEQTLSSLRTYTLEETHEVLEAIDLAVHENDWSALRSELGDRLCSSFGPIVLTQFHSIRNLSAFTQ